MRHYCANHKKQSKKSHDRGIFLFRGYRKSFSSRQSISTTGQKNGNATCDGVVFPSHRAPPRRIHSDGWVVPGEGNPQADGGISPPGVPFFPKEGEYPSATTTPFVIPAQAGIQLTHCVNLCHLALLRKFAFANWIPRARGMTTARHSPSFTAPAEKKGWIVSKANKTGQFSIIATTPDIRTFHPPRRCAPPLLWRGIWLLFQPRPCGGVAERKHLFSAMRGRVFLHKGAESSALLRKFAFANWIPRARGMTTARHSPSFTAIAEKKGWIVSKANKTGQFSIIATTPDIRAIHNYPTVYNGSPPRASPT